MLLVVLAGAAVLWWGGSFAADDPGGSPAGEPAAGPAPAVGGATARAPASPDPRLEVVDHGWRGRGSGDARVTGTVVNRSDRPYRFVQVIIVFYDRSGGMVGSTFENVSGLGAAEEWSFRAAVPHAEASSYEIAGVIGRRGRRGRPRRSSWRRALQSVNPFAQKDALEERNDSLMRKVRDLTKDNQRRE